MTETEWLASDDPGAMLDYLLEERHGEFYGPVTYTHRTSNRKLRLWVEACRQASEPGRTSWSYDLDKPKHLCRAVAEWSRRDNEDDHGTAASRAALLREVVGNPFRPVKLPEGARHKVPCGHCGKPLSPLKKDTLPLLSACPKCGWQGPFWADVEKPGPSPWLTPDVLAMATAAYDQRDEVTAHLDPVRLAILADALEEVGCMPYGWCRLCAGPPSRTRLEGEVCVAHDEDLGPHPVLEHLRSPGPHVRGCWAIDLILGKE